MEGGEEKEQGKKKRYKVNGKGMEKKKATEDMLSGCLHAWQVPR